MADTSYRLTGDASQLLGEFKKARAALAETGAEALKAQRSLTTLGADGGKSGTQVAAALGKVPAANAQIAMSFKTLKDAVAALGPQAAAQLAPLFKDLERLGAEAEKAAAKVKKAGAAPPRPPAPPPPPPPPPPSRPPPPPPPKLGDLTTSLGATGFKAASDMTTLLGASAAGAKKTLAQLAAEGKNVSAEMARITALTTPANAAIAQTAVAARAAAAAHGVAAAGSMRHAQQQRALGHSTKMTAAEMTQMSYQLQDFFVQVQGGQGILTPLLQQGSQLAGTFGGVGGALRAIATLFTPARIAMIAFSAVAGGLGFILNKARQEANAFEDALTLTGHAAGLTADSFTNMAESIQRSNPRAAIGDIRGTLQQLVATGHFTSTSIMDVGNAITTVARVSGKDTKDVVADFASMSNGVAAWATNATKQYNYLTAAQLRQIKTLESQGKVQDAVALNSKLLNDHLKNNERQLGTFETAWNSIGHAAQRAWQSILNIGREATLVEKLASATKNLAYHQEQIKIQGDKGPGNAAQVKLHEDAVARINSEIEGLRKADSAAQAKADNDSKRTEKNAAEIAREAQAFQSAAASKDTAQAAQRAAQRDLQLNRDLIALERNYDEQKVSTEAYQQERYNIELRGIQSRRQLAADEEKAAKQVQPGDEPGRVAAEQRQLDFQTKLIGFKKEEDDLNEKLRRFGFERSNAQPLDFKPWATVTAGYIGDLKKQVGDLGIASSDVLRRFEHGQRPEIDDSTRQRHAAAIEAQRSLAEENKRANIDLIRDDQTRGLAQIANEERFMRERLDIGATMAAEEQAIRSRGAMSELDIIAWRVDREKELEQGLADWRVTRERQLTEQLKPEWQRRLDDWKDSTKGMKDHYDQFLDNWVQSGEDAWVKLVQTGKFKIKDFGQMIVAESARGMWREFMRPLWTEMGKAVAPKGSTGAGGSAGMIVDFFGSLGKPKTGAPADEWGTIEARRARETQTDLQIATQRTATAFDGLTDLFGTGANAFVRLLDSMTGGGASNWIGKVASVASSFSSSYNAGYGSSVTAPFDVSGSAPLPMGSGAALGAVIGPDGWHNFAKGDIVDSPTFFKFAQGGAMKLGQMGEAGPEAIMPLKRGKGGALGVQVDRMTGHEGIAPLKRMKDGSLGINFLQAGVTQFQAGLKYAPLKVHQYADGGIFPGPLPIRFAGGGTFEPMKRDEHGNMPGQRAGSVNIHNYAGVAVETKEDGPDLHVLLERAAEEGAKRGEKRAVARMVRDHATGSGPSSTALKSRGIRMVPGARRA